MTGHDHRPAQFGWDVADRVATITLRNPERDNALTFTTYRELLATFRSAREMDDVKAVVITGAGENFSAGDDLRDVLGPLVELRDDEDLDGLLSFTRLTGSLVAAMRDCPQPIVAAIDGLCSGSAAALALASDLRLGTPGSRVDFAFAAVGLSGAHMGACSLLPRIIGAGRTAELLYTGRAMSSDVAERWGFYNRIVSRSELLAEAHAMALSLATGPTYAHALTKRCLHHEWPMSPDDALGLDAEAQALCMQSEDFARAYRALSNDATPIFEGN